MSWVVEILVFGAITLIVISLDLQEDKLSQIAGVFSQLIPSINYAIFPTIQVLTSQDLRLHVFGQLSCKCFRDQQGGAGVEEIELNVLANGDVPHQDPESAPVPESNPDPESAPDPHSAPDPVSAPDLESALPQSLPPSPPLPWSPPLPQRPRSAC